MNIYMWLSDGNIVAGNLFALAVLSIKLNAHASSLYNSIQTLKNEALTFNMPLDIERITALVDELNQGLDDLRSGDAITRSKLARAAWKLNKALEEPREELMKSWLLDVGRLPFLSLSQQR